MSEDPFVPAPAQPPGWTEDWSAQRDPAADASARRRRGVMLGVASCVAVLAALAVAVFATALALVGGFVLLPVALLVAVAGVALAVASLVALARGGGGLTKLLSASPAIGSLLVLGLIAWGWYAGSDPELQPPSRPVAATAPPDRVVSEMVSAMVFGRWGDACLLLAERVRPGDCTKREPLCGGGCDSIGPGFTELVSERGDRAVVSYSEDLSGPEHRVRLERGPNGWELLDVPYVLDSCVDTARDAFTCPVRPGG